MTSSTSFLHDDAPVPAGFDGLSLPVHHATTVVFSDTRSLLDADEFSEEGYYYALGHTPTTLQLSAKIAAIEGGTQAVLTPSGMAAIALTYLATVRPGDHVLLPKNAYRPNYDFARTMLTELGVTVLDYEPDETDLGARVSEQLRLLWIEAPGSLTLETPDVQRLINQARSVGAQVAIDNTWSAGVYFQPLALGADFSIQALSKYQGGASDVFMGAVVTQRAEDHARLKRASVRLGYSVSADDCFLVCTAVTAPFGHVWPRTKPRRCRLRRRSRSIRRCSASCIRRCHRAEGTTIGSGCSAGAAGCFRLRSMGVTRSMTCAASSMRCAASKSGLVGAVPRVSPRRTGRRAGGRSRSGVRASFVSASAWNVLMTCKKT